MNTYWHARQGFMSNLSVPPYNKNYLLQSAMHWFLTVLHKFTLLLQLNSLIYWMLQMLHSFALSLLLRSACVLDATSAAQLHATDATAFLRT